MLEILIFLLKKNLVLFLVLFIGDQMFGIVESPGTNLNTDPSIRYTVLFNIFVFFQIFNEINVRKIKHGK